MHRLAAVLVACAVGLSLVAAVAGCKSTVSGRGKAVDKQSGQDLTKAVDLPKGGAPNLAAKAPAAK